MRGLRYGFALILATCLCGRASLGLGQETGDVFQAYPLRHAQAAEVEPQLVRLLSGLPAPPEIISEARGNRLLVRGTPQAQQMVRQFLATLDQPARKVEEAATLKAYPVAGDLAATARQLQTAYAAQAEVRIATDARTGQLLVLAPPQVHAEIARQLGGTPAANTPPAATPSTMLPAAAPLVGPPQAAAPVTAAAQYARPADVVAAGRPLHTTVNLRNSNWDQIARALGELMPGRLSPLQSNAQANAFTLAMAGGGDVQMQVDARNNQIELYGPATFVNRLSRLLLVLDTPQGPNDRRTSLVPVSNSREPSVRRAVQVLHESERPAAAGAAAVRTAVAIAPSQATPVPGTATPIGAAPAHAGQRQGSGTIPLVAQLFQPQAQQQAPAAAANQNVAQNAAQPAPGAPLQAPPLGSQIPLGTVGPGDDTITGLTGPVQIEFLEGLDIMIISGNQRDVERVSQIIADIERLTDQTAPAIVVHPLSHVGSEAVAAIVTQLYDQALATRQGRVSITALVKPNALMLIGRKESVDRVIDLVDRLDQPVGPATQFAVFNLKHASAADAQTTITTFLTGRTGLGTRALVTAEFRTNSLIVQASPRDLAEVAELIARIDTVSSGAIEELRVFPLKNSLADELAPVLQDAISGQGGGGTAGRPGGVLAAVAGAQQAGGGAGGSSKSTMLRLSVIDPQGQRELRSGILADVRITPDPRANALLVSGPAESMDLIGAIIDQLDQIPAAESQIKVFTVVNGDAQLMTQMLQSLFGQQQAAGGGGLFGGGGGAAQAAASFLGESPLISLRFSVDQRTNSIIASGSAGDLNIVEAILLRLDESDVKQRQSIVYRLKNAPALAVATTINNFLQSERNVQNLAPTQISPFQQIEREVVVVPEQVSNSLIVSATPRYFEEIRKIVEELDARPPMVMIQVLIGEVTLNNTDEFGVELGIQDSILFDRSLLGDLVTTTNSTQVPQGNTVVTTTQQIIQAASNTPGFNFNNTPLGNSGSTQSLAGADKLGGQALSSFSVGRVNGDLGFGGLVLSASSESISILVRALKECRRLEVLSRPQIMTLDNQPAFIQVGARVPRVTGVTQGQVGIAPQLVVQDENVGLILGVTPRISPDGLVVMEIDTERSSLGPESEGVPITTSTTGEVIRTPLINTATAQTTVSAMDGQTVVLGGLITKSKSSTRRRVPLLSSIPVLGNLFRYDLEIQQRTELLIIMTPHVVRTEGDADRVKQAEAARLSWCLADVRRMHGDPGIHSRDVEWPDDQTRVVYPDQNPAGAETVPTPVETPNYVPSAAPEYLPQPQSVLGPQQMGPQQMGPAMTPPQGMSPQGAAPLPSGQMQSRPQSPQPTTRPPAPQFAPPQPMPQQQRAPAVLPSSATVPIPIPAPELQGPQLPPANDQSSQSYRPPPQRGGSGVVLAGGVGPRSASPAGYGPAANSPPTAGPGIVQNTAVPPGQVPWNQPTAAQPPGNYPAAYNQPVYQEQVRR